MMREVILCLLTPFCCAFCFVAQRIGAGLWTGVKVFMPDRGVGQLSMHFGWKGKLTDPHGDAKVVLSQRPETYEV